jgi:DNA-directed RNA polymerase specialized sigma24 family protein
VDDRSRSDPRPGLLPTALLLTGDRATAEELVQRALARAPRRTGDPEAAALAALVRATTGRWARLGRAEQVIEALPDPFGTPQPADPGPDLARALRELPARTRAAVVLRWHDRLPDARIAALLRCPVGEVADEAARGLAQLRPALEPSAYERAAPDVPAEQRLADQLRRLANAPGSWRLDAAAAVADVQARRSGVRRRLAVTAVATLAVVGVVVPLARWAPDPPATTAAAPATAPAAPSTPAGPPVPVLTGPTRGSLAGDTAFLDAVRSVSWGAQEAPPPADREVVFAADTLDGRVALVVGTVLEDFRGVWLTGANGASAADLVPHLPRQLGRDRPLTLVLGGPGDATLVVVAAPGDTVAVSDRLMTGPRGTVGRTYTPVPAGDGVAIVPARTTAAGSAVSVRVTRDGRDVYRSAADWPGAGTAPVAEQPALTPLRPGAVPDPHVVDAALTDLAIPLGVEPAVLQPDLLWSADLTLDRGTGSVAVLVGHSPGGALVVTTWAGIGNRAVGCGTQTPPGTTDVATLSVARVCEAPLPAPGRSGDGRWLVVTAPPDAASAQLLGSRGQLLGPLPLTGGGAVVPMTDGARSVRTLDAAGRSLAETPIAPVPTAPFGDFGSGPAG